MTPAKGPGAVRRWLPHVAAGIVLGVLLIWDRPVYAAIGGFRSPFLTWLTDRVSQLRGATFPAVVGLLLIAIGLTARKARLRRAGAAMVLTILLAGGITTVMKVLIDRPGPAVEEPARPGESWLDSRFGRFPSTHSAALFGAASTLAAFVPGAGVLGYTVAVLVCHERIYRGTHFPSDIFAGIWIGLVVARFVVAQLARRGWMDDLVPARPASARRGVRALVFAEKKPKVGDGEDPA
jgi:membrane-associated phospholipid phosphatase